MQWVFGVKGSFATLLSSCGSSSPYLCYNHSVDCSAVSCQTPVCEQGQFEEVPLNECCPVCRGTSTMHNYNYPVYLLLVSVSEPCDTLNCTSPGYECQVHQPSGTPFCSPLCVPGSCPPLQQCSISLPVSCEEEPCPGNLDCRPSKPYLNSPGVLQS